jgi:hypothetical protein
MGKPQVPPLRCAPVGMTRGKMALPENRRRSPLPSRPERTRISYFALLATTKTVARQQWPQSHLLFEIPRHLDLCPHLCGQNGHCQSPAYQS